MHQILIGHGLLPEIHTGNFDFSKIAVITDENVSKLHLSKLYESAATSGIEIHAFTFPAGESHKTRKTKERLEDALLAKGFGKDSCLFSLGGGVVSDIAGYLAATYCRGIPLFSFPTTLIGMVDASLGGKNGVNVPQGKNLIGTSYSPQKIVIDLSTLQTLPKNERANGMVEMIKHGLIASKEHFLLIEQEAEALLELDKRFLETAVRQSCGIKMAIVEAERTMPEKRHLLNFGHTIGHALEALSEYTLSHGEAVALGILAESYLSIQRNLFSKESLDRIRNIFLRIGIPLKLPQNFSKSAMFTAMQTDKKSLRNAPRFVLLEGIGQARSERNHFCFGADAAQLEHTLDWMQNAFDCL